jgi:hypothetical protein
MKSVSRLKGMMIDWFGGVSGRSAGWDVISAGSTWTFATYQEGQFIPTWRPEFASPKDIVITITVEDLRRDIK